MVYDVLAHGLRLKNRIARGDKPNLTEEQSALLGKLSKLERFDQAMGTPAAQIDPTKSMDVFGGRAVDHGAGGGTQFKGMRYALACWLDEVFIALPQVGPQWEVQSLEQKLFGHRLRHSTYWEQANRAEVDARVSDPVEVYYLCAMLGFRGNRDAGGLKDWRHKVERRLQESQEKEPADPPAGQPPKDTRPLRGHERLRKAVILLFALLALLIPLTTAFLVSRLGS